jgi:hypothetical protein
MTPPHVVVVPAEALADLELAAVLLNDVRIAVPDGQLLGSGTTMANTAADLAAFLTVLTYTWKAGHVDLAVAGKRPVGVASWYRHPGQPHRPRERTPRSRRPSDQESGGVLAGLRTRFDLLDGGFGVPYDRTHHHLCYLAAVPGYGTYLITELLLTHRARAADKAGHELYLEVHDAGNRTRLSRLGYRDLGGSLGDQRAPRSWAMRRPAVTAPGSPEGGLGTPDPNTGGGR